MSIKKRITELEAKAPKAQRDEKKPMQFQSYQYICGLMGRHPQLDLAGFNARGLLVSDSKKLIKEICTTHPTQRTETA